MSLNLAYLSLGSNLGDKETNLQKAVDLIGKIPGVQIKAKSSLYQTDPVGYLEQDCFLNAVLKVETSLSPLELLDKTQEVEKALGRKRLIHWGPRSIDIDILLYNQETILLPRLTVPHPEMHKRGFVLVPLNEIDNTVFVPSLGLVKDLLNRLEVFDSVLLVKTPGQW
ncbi:MAG: 2-amino-4-hydroxy-6-hydroxymethyldihydropteridine diphosphokinase [Desulfitobacteriaceae bacterium]|nr:2-amino-4-hydroxy-6-hydroxymethyldihydropteridine diphosphokinase [Desulfitobacteriaceae bacterium]MDD4752425.1 2-amino-4-hydroxy-6-hydroxymethyldihydropteridine diphosphokinase [Desulfitobacteriaceae bacterium]